MGNMSYCRFYTTNHALDNCLLALDPEVNEYELSEEEEQVGIAMFNRFLEYCIDKDIIHDYDAARVIGVFEEHRAEIKAQEDCEED